MAAVAPVRADADRVKVRCLFHRRSPR
jgi:hypothetical protein